MPRILALWIGFGLALGGCWYGGSIGAGTRRPDFGNVRNPDPMADPNRQVTENMWSPNPEKGKAQHRGRRGRMTRGQRIGGLIGAAMAYAVAGWTPLVQYQGEFEEDPHQAKQYRAEDAAVDAEEARKRRKRVEQAPKTDVGVSGSAAPGDASSGEPSTEGEGEVEGEGEAGGKAKPAPVPRPIRLWP